MANITSLDDLRKRREQEEASRQNEYYTGGASAQGGSGLSVLSPGDRPQGNPVDDILAQARQHAAAGAPPPGAEERLVNVTFYENGFTVGDGPLREPGIPENDRFLADVQAGICPRELIVDGQPSSVQISDKRGERFKPPAYVAFAGAGQSAGSAAVAGQDSSVVSPSTQVEKPPVDEGEPTVRVQLAYENRKREVVTLNKHHTVRHLTAFVNASGNVTGPYQLLASTRGPPKPVTNLEENIVDAGLAGASVTVKSVQ
mmetsp:Transcript_16696/g.47584  ORF Transcript_16696/g.47584 Transcript_16696/m.47584 type:complete len:258 (-) Transcript_16696:503-1276(-)